jgi:hypothetical protein
MERTYSNTEAAITGVIGFQGNFDGKFEGATMTIAIVALEL